MLGSWERHQAVCQAPQRGNALNMGNGDQHCTFLMLKANDASAAEAVTPEDRDAASKADKDQPFESSISALDETQRSKVSSCKSIATASDLTLIRVIVAHQNCDCLNAA